MSHPTIHKTMNQQAGVRIAKGKISVRPTLIVGLGGTGCNALQWVNELLRDLFGNIPPFIKLLAIDSDVIDPVRGVTHQFPRADFYNLFEYIRVGDIIRDYSRFPDFHPALRILEGLKLPSAIVERGCQGLSRLGRVVFFETWERVIYRAVYERFNALKTSTLRADVANLPPVGQFELTGSPVVHMIGSICGGTGSGMLIDMAYALQSWGEESFNSKPEIYGHLLLPEAFRIETRPIMDKLRAVGHSMLQQIEFLMDSRRGSLEVEYPGGTKREFSSKSAPFNSCFLINGHSSDGGGTRSELVELIARTVKTMTVEPAGSHIYSDLNNKQLDILSTEDGQTKRLMCFSSYGLSLGVYQEPKSDPHMRDLMLQWLYDGIGSCTRPRFAKTEDETKVRSTFRELITDKLSPEAILQAYVTYEGKAKSYKLPEYLPSAGAGDHDAWQHVVDSIHRHFEDVSKDLRRVIKDACKSRRTDFEKQLNESLRELTETGASDDAEKLPILPVVKVYEEHLSRLRKDEARRDSGVTEADLELKIRDGVYKLFMELRKDPSINSNETILFEEADMVSNWVNLEFGKYLAELKNLLAAREYLESLKAISEHTTKPLVRNLENLSQAAKEIELRVNYKAEETTATNGSTKKPRKTRDADSPFAVPLFERKDPNDRNSKVPAELVLRLKNIVQEIVWKFLDSSKSRVAGQGSDEARRLQGVMDELKNLIDDWKEDYGIAELHSTFRTADPRDPSAHPLFDSVDNIHRRLTPKIAVNKTARHTSSMRTLVSQFPDNSCFAVLLQAIVGSDFRESLIDESYAKHSGVYLQLLNLGVGFCLPALDNLDQYKTAGSQYVFKEDELWLDPTWPDLYRNLMSKFEEEAHASKQKEEESRQATRQRADECKASLAQLDALLRPFFSDVSLACKTFTEFDDQESGMECHTRVQLARSECLDTIESLRKLPIEDLQYLTKLSDPIMDRVEKGLLKNYLIPQTPLFAATVQARFHTLREAYDDLIMHYDANR